MEINPNNLDDLILAHLDERLSDKAFGLLSRYLEGSPEARLRYAELARLDAGLNDRALTDSEFDARVSSKLGTHRWLALAAILALLALPFSLLFGPNRDDRLEFTSLSTTQTKGVAVITAESNAVWASSPSLSVGVALEPGRVILKEGLAQIDFFGGASVSLSGPAEIELAGRNAITLLKGKIRADVPPAARGFEVRTSEVVLEDLGTSFGVSVGEDNESEMIVFDGEVRVIGRDGSPLLLTDGEAASLSRGQATLKDASKIGAFPDIADVLSGSGNREESEYEVWKEHSLDRRGDKRLVAYYDFEDLTPASRRLRNQALNGLGSELDGGIVGARVSEGRWGRKTALDFRAEGDRVRFQIPGEFDALSLAAWVRIDALDRQLNSLFLTDYFDENEIHWQLDRRGFLHFACSPKGVVDIPKHNRRFFSDRFWTPQLSGNWFLLVTTVQSGPESRVIHYINGKAVGLSGGTQMDKPLPLMRIGKADLGNWTEPIWPEASIRTLNGRIDEFAIYSTVLPAQEIAQLYLEGKP